MGQEHYKPTAPGGVCTDSRNRAGSRWRAWANPAQGGLIRSGTASIVARAMSPRCGGATIANPDGKRRGASRYSRCHRRDIEKPQPPGRSYVSNRRLPILVCQANLMRPTIAPAARNGGCDVGVLAAGSFGRRAFPVVASRKGGPETLPTRRRGSTAHPTGDCPRAPDRLESGGGFWPGRDARPEAPGELQRAGASCRRAAAGYSWDR